MYRLLIFIIFFSTSLSADYKAKAQEIYNFYLNSEYSEAAKIITAMTVLESAWYTSKYHNDYNNHYSRKIPWKECKKKSKPIECMKQYNTLEEANIEMLGYFKRKGYSRSEEGFLFGLVKYGYAVDPEYVKKVKKIIIALKKRKVFKIILDK